MQIKLKKGKDSKWYSMPDTWDELSLDKYMSVMSYLTNEKTTDHTRLVMMIHHLTDIPEQDLWNMTIPDLTQINEVMKGMLQSEPNQELKHILNIKGKKYGFHPKLKNVSLGEFVDIEMCIKEGMYENLHTLLSILYRPIIEEDGDKYIIEDYQPSQDRANLFRDNLKVEDINGASVFFYALGAQLLETMAVYLKAETMRERLMQFRKNGDGMKLSTD
tara:strand:- start:1126 stop:1779 length:654 start_codon:yes stop_codon:yes gene_type:complete